MKLSCFELYCKKKKKKKKKKRIFSVTQNAKNMILNSINIAKEAISTQNEEACYNKDDLPGIHYLSATKDHLDTVVTPSVS